MSDIVERPSLMTTWAAPWSVTADGIEDCNGCWIMSASNIMLCYQIVALANYAYANEEVIDTLRQRAEKAEKERDELRERLEIGPHGEDAVDVAESAMGFLRHRADAAEARIKVLETALEPFADKVSKVEASIAEMGFDLPPDSLTPGWRFTWGKFRALRAALERKANV